MQEEEINTYCQGFSLIARKNVTKKEFIQFLNNLSECFNQHYKTTEYSFSPEQITEGGIVFDNFNCPEKYKTMRLYFTTKQLSGKTSLYGNQWIKDTVKEDWKDSNEILIPEGSYLDSFLKSFCAAPKYTNTELRIFLKCFNNIGLELYKKPKGGGKLFNFK